MMTTNLKIAGRVSLPFSLLLSATLIACGSEGPMDDEAALDGMTSETEASRLAGDGDGTGASQVTAPEAIDNSAPCGDRTIAVVHSSAGSTYAFCGFGPGKTGVLEDLPSGDVRASLLDVFDNPADLLRAVAPEGAALPDHLIASVESGVVAEDHQPLYPVKLGLPSLMTPMAGGYCENTPDFYADHGWSSSWIPFMEEFVVDAQSCDMHIWDATGGQVTWHQHTASTNPVYNEISPPWAGACGAKEHVLSCGGTTLFQALRQEAPGDAWTTALSHTVSANAVATWKMYASGCSPYQDRDDMRFRGDSAPGANHYYTTFFVKWLDGVSCVYD